MNRKRRRRSWMMALIMLMLAQVWVPAAGAAADALDPKPDEAAGMSISESVYGGPRVTGSVYGGPRLLQTLNTAEDGEGAVVYAYGISSHGLFGDDSLSQTIPRAIESLQGYHVVDIAAGDQHALALTAEGDVYAFGRGREGQLGNGAYTIMQRPPLHVFSGISQVSAGSKYSLVLTVSGAVYAFGHNNLYGESGGDSSYLGLGVNNEFVYTPTIIPVPERIVAVDAGYTHSMLLTEEGEVYVTGTNYFGELGLGPEVYETMTPVKLTSMLPPGTKIKAISAGSAHSLVLTEQGEVYGFGNNLSGSVGAGEPVRQYVPLRIDALAGQEVVSIYAGRNYSLVVTSEGKLYTFGDGRYGKLGIGPLPEGTTYVPVPTEVPAAKLGGGRVLAAVGGNYHSMVLTDSRAVYTFGMKGYLGAGTDNDAYDPIQIMPPGSIQSIAAGSEVGYLISRGPTDTFDVPSAPTGVQAVASEGSVTVTFSPSDYDGGTPILRYGVILNAQGAITRIDAAAGPVTFYGLLNGTTYDVTVVAVNGRGESAPSTGIVRATPQLPVMQGFGLFGFGNGGNGQLGTNDNASFNRPVSIAAGLGELANFSAGDGHTLFATKDGHAYASGYGERGQLGTGSSQPKSAPTPISLNSSSPVTAVSAGQLHSLLLTADGAVYSFGYGVYGALGHGTYDTLYVPMQIAALSGERAVAVAAGSNNSLVLTERGDVYVFGGGPSVPGLIRSWPSDEKAIAIASGSTQSLILTSSGDVYAFGGNSVGQLGLGDTQPRSTPTKITMPNGERVVAIAAGGSFSLLLGESGKVYSFGLGNYGQLGHGNTSNQLTPKAIEGLAGKRAVAIAAGGQMSLVATKTNGVYELFAFGRGDAGELGLGAHTNTMKNLPSAVGALSGKRITDLSAGGAHSLVLTRDRSDTVSPVITGAALGPRNTYVDLTFDEPVYGTANGAGALWAGDFALSFASNGGGATGATITAARQPTGETAETAAPLTGGETTVRVFLSYTGSAIGVEKLKLAPIHGLAVYDESGNPMAASQSTADLTLGDVQAPTIVSAARTSDTSVTVTLSEASRNLTKANDGGFRVEETLSGGTIVYPVSAIVQGADNKHVDLTVANMAASGMEGVTVHYTQGGGGNGTVVDLAGNALATSSDGASIAAWDTTAPAITGVARQNDTTLIVTLNEEVVNADQANDGGFTVVQTGSGGSIAYAVTATAQGATSKQVLLTVANIGASGKAGEGVTVFYTASGNGKLSDTAGNPVGSATVGSIDAWDTAAPTLVSAVREANGNAYVDITFSEGVYTGNDGTGGVTEADLKLVFTKGSGGNATGAAISAVRKADGATAETATALAGGETTVRAFLTTTGTPRGVETIQVKPFDGNSIFDKAGNPIAATAQSSTLLLADKLAPTITEVTRSSNTSIRVKFSEPLLEASIGGLDGGFVVEETGSAGAVHYPVSAISLDGTAIYVTLTVADMSVSGKEGVTVSYTAGGNGTIADTNGNPAATVPMAGTIAGWDTVLPEIIDKYMDSSNTFFDLTFNKGVYASANGTEGLTPENLKLEYVAGGNGTVTSVSIASLKRLNLFTQEEEGDLTGGEQGIRVYITVNGIPNDNEYIIVQPADGSSIFDKAGNAMEVLVSDPIPLTDMIAPTITGVERQDDTTLVVAFNENIFFDPLFYNGEFTVEETGSNGTVVYEVTAVDFLNDTDYTHAVLTVSDLSLSAREGVLVKYTNTGFLMDWYGNLLETTETEVSVDPWDTSNPAISSAAWGPQEAYVELTFSEGVYTSSNATGGVSADDFTLEFTANGGNATAAALTAVTAADGVTALAGGETAIRVTVAVTGTPSGSETVELRAKDGAAIFDRAGNALDAAATTGAKALADRLAPAITAVERTSDTTIVVTLSEAAVQLTQPNDGGFAVVETGSDGSVTYAVTGTAEGADAQHVELTVANMSASGKEGVTVRYTADGNGLIADEAGNTLASTAGSPIPAWDTTAPEWTASSAVGNNTYIDLTFSEGVYTSANGTGGVSTDDFTLMFTANGGNATSAAITAVTAADGATALAGGETTVRVTFTVTGTPGGSETVELRVKDGAAIYDRAGNALDAAATTGAKALADRLAPAITAVERTSDTTIVVTLSEAALYLTQPNDGGFTIEETGSGGSVPYAVTSTAQGADALHVVLTVADVSASGKEGVTVRYTAGGNGLIADAAGNILASTAGTPIAGWDAQAPTIVQVSLSEDNTFLDVTFSEGLYTELSGSGGVTPEDFSLVFNRNNGTATDTAIAAVRKNDASTPQNAQQLSGGEITVRVFLDVTGTPNGSESVELTPSSAVSIFDRAGNPVEVSATTGFQSLHNRRPDPEPGSVAGGPGGNIPGNPPSKPEGIAVIVDGVAQEQTATATVTTEGNRKKTTVEVDEPKISANLDKSSNGTTISIPVMNNSTAVNVELNGRLVQSMEDKNAVVEVKTELATYTIPAAQFKVGSIMQQIGAGIPLQEINISVEMNQLPTGSITITGDKETGLTLVAAPIDFHISAYYEGRSIDVSQFDVYVERTIVIPDGVDPNRITTGVVIGADGQLIHVPTKIVRQEGHYVAVIRSLTNSVYSVIYKRKTFEDVRGHWAQQPVEDLAARLIVEGTDSSSYSPNANVTRAEFAVLMVRALGLRAGVGQAEFGDVSKADWFYEEVGTAAQYKLIEGDEQSRFQPNRLLTREEAMVVAARAMSLAGRAATPQGNASAVLQAFSDGGEVSPWAANAAAWSVRAALIEGYGDAIRPKQNITRAETAAIIQRLLRAADLIND